jgi:5-(aminomethyl)-3-furanmethanol phosphate kinase
VSTRQSAGLTVIKVGGGLSRIPGALTRVCLGVERIASTRPLVVIPGGGPFADAVRRFDAEMGLSADAAHWMGLLAMDQYAHVLAEHIRRAELVDEPGAVLTAVGEGKVPVLAPYRWMRAADVLPHTWGVTSDSVAAFIAGALGAARLVLVKPTGDGDTDPYFSGVVPVGLPCLTLGWETLEELESRISE